MKQTKNNPFFIILCATFVIIISTLIIFSLKKTNPSNLNPSNGCIKAGCSGQLCIEERNSSKIGITTCEWKESYKCFKYETCERQKSGQCGFTSTKESKKCQVDNLPKILQELVY